MANATGCGRRSAASRRLHHRLAADEARELAQPYEYALPGQLLEAVIEAQQQSAAFDHHRRLRQHAGGRGGHEVGDAQGGAEHAGAVEHAGRDEFAQAGREFLVNKAHMAEEHSKRNKGAARMVDGDEGGIGDGVERLLAGDVGGGSPADCGGEAGCDRRRRREGGHARRRNRRSSALSSSPEDAMKRSVQAINSSPWAGERERSTLSSLAVSINGSFSRSSASSIE